MEKADEEHYLTIAEKLAGGRMIPFLGAGANLCDRGDEEWEQGGPFLPSGAELAGYLAAARPVSAARRSVDLLRVSQYVDAARGEDELYLYLREVFDSEYSPTSLHRLLARVAKALGEGGSAAARWW